MPWCGVTAVMRDALLQVVASLLHLGAVRFVENAAGDGSEGAGDCWPPGRSRASGRARVAGARARPGNRVFPGAQAREG